MILGKSLQVSCSLVFTKERKRGRKRDDGFAPASSCIHSVFTCFLWLYLITWTFFSCIFSQVVDPRVSCYLYMCQRIYTCTQSSRSLTTLVRFSSILARKLSPTWLSYDQSSITPDTNIYPYVCKK